MMWKEGKDEALLTDRLKMEGGGLRSGGDADNRDSLR